VFKFVLKSYWLILATALLLALPACGAAQTSQPALEPTQPQAATTQVNSPTVQPPAPTQTPVEPTLAPTQPANFIPTDTPLAAPTEAPLPPAPTASQIPVKGTLKAVLIAIGDAGQSGEKIGCDDSAVVIDLPITSTGNPYRDVLQALIDQRQQFYGESGLYNALYQSTLQIQDAALDSDGKLTVQFSGSLMLGGECDDPRAKAQLEGTLRQFPEVKDVAIFVNGVPLDQLLSGRG
jgi:hypothetical protein